MKRHLSFTTGTVALVFLCFFAVLARADSVVISDDGSENRFPFGYDASESSNYEDGSQYQQFYSAGDFTGQPILITSIAFATSGDSNAVAAAYSLDVYLGVAATSAGDPSTTFADNIGSSYQEVYSGPYSFVPQDDDTFDFVLNLTTPYLYNPSSGDLLFDVALTLDPVIAGTLYFDGDISSTDSRVSNATPDATTGSTNAFTLYTQITYTPYTSVPEPSTLGLLSLTGIVFWAIKRRRS